MMDNNCTLNFRILPAIYATEIAQDFALELQLGKNTQWGIGKFKKECNHWQTRIDVGEHCYIPNLCFKTRGEAEDYCEQMAMHFPRVCRVLLGVDSVKYSSN